MSELFFPGELGLDAAFILVATSATTSFLTAAAGIGGGVALLALRLLYDGVSMLTAA